MIITKAYKIRLYPTKRQQVFFNKTMGACRVIYNEMLYRLTEDYKNFNKKYNFSEKYKLFKEIKSKYQWIKDCDSQGIAQIQKDIDSAFINFFKNRTKFPKYKNKKEKKYI